MQRNWLLLGIALLVAILDEDEATTTTTEQSATATDEQMDDDTEPTATDVTVVDPTEPPEDGDFTMGDDVIITALDGRDGILTGFSGLTLYIFDNDEPGVSNCTGACADAWPPYSASDLGKAIFDTPLAGTLSIIVREDGDAQFTYNGQPLYHYADDVEPGDRNGDGIAGVWHIVTVGG